MRHNRIEVRATCPSCGPMLVDGGSVRCGLEPRKPVQALCELSCPSCSRPILFSTVPAVMETLFSGGATQSAGAIPFELLEPHAGPPLSWDDVVDFTAALESSSWPQLELGD